MISRKRMILLAATNIADHTGLDNDTALKAAEAAFTSIGLTVISPLLDVLDFDVRPLFRERVVQDVRDLLATPPEAPALNDEPQSIEVQDE